MKLIGVTVSTPAPSNKTIAAAFCRVFYQIPRTFSRMISHYNSNSMQFRFDITNPMTTANICTSWRQHFPRYWSIVRGTTGHRWISFMKASDAELWCFLWSAPEQTANIRDAGDSRCHHAHYGVTVMWVRDYIAATSIKLCSYVKTRVKRNSHLIWIITEIGLRQ